MCILSGCDYLSSLPGIGLRKAQNIVKERKTIENILLVIGNRFPKEFIDKFVKANAAFLYQFVFDSTSRTYVRLNPLPKNIKLDLLSGLGESPQNRYVPLLKSNNAIRFDNNHILKNTKGENIDPFVQLNPSEFNEFEFDDKVLQDIEVILNQVEPVVKPPSTPTSSRMVGPKYNSSPSNVNNTLSLLSPSVNTADNRVQLTALLKQNVSSFTVWKDKKPEKSFFRARSPLPPLPPPSFKPVVNKENIAHTIPFKQQSVKKRKSLSNDYLNPFAKVKKSFANSDISIAKREKNKK
jgi:hypothetical protein